MRETLFENLIKKNIHIATPCGGKGTCGKCLAEIAENGLIRTVRACRVYMDELPTGASVRVKTEEDFYILADAAELNHSDLKLQSAAICVDIGTTTIVICLTDIASGSVIDSYAFINRQRAYGADVISRILESEKNPGEMNRIVVSDIADGIKKLTDKNGVMEIKKICVAGNACMIGFFLNINCMSMGRSPFAADERLLKYSEYDSHEIFGGSTTDLPKCNVQVLPAASAFVGGDVISGILAMGLDKSEKNILYVDIGTNGEIAFLSGGKAYMASAAAGPALEGGNISCGVGSVSGAVSGVKYREGAFVIETIGGASPAGICGSGVISAVSELLRHGFIDETGLLSDEYFDSGVEICEGVTITQADIRNIQLAKAAVRAGIECTAYEAGVGLEAVDTVYIAGGFGNFIDMESAVNIGLFPEMLRDKMQIIGNAALLGTVMLASSDDFISRADSLTSRAVTVNLGGSIMFSEKFIDHMDFELVDQ